ncbi:DEAD/DEAH box helicase [Aquabacterium sp. A08]|uniref:DEAD/DEAH box helicase n=1 Tax=Aquabacterium sp. A08 TaxID=2718532 RepID=UPI001421BCA5|nr:DEAD/DEAH box helicase [Aquabacterium sp. A08]NIC40482.1 DEAD/DEAH box helicase [Aquabacterium sp. A08]
MTFEDLKLAPAILEAVREQGYETPTPIQAEAIPAVLEGHDLLAGAQTGTGKTAAFTLPLLHRLSEQAPATGAKRAIRALVLAPTRELAAQVEESVKAYGKHLKLKSAVIFGGVGMNPQINALNKGVDIVVATPGRLLDLIEQGHVDLSQIQIMVLDEADRMLDMGFIHDVKKILKLVPKQKQSLLFSATFSDEIRELANGLLNNPRSIQVTPPNTTVQRIKQTIHPVGRGKKKALLAHIINQHNWSQVLVFTRTKFGANNVAEFLEKNGISAMALHGNKSQSARTQALAGFKTGELRALVATDIAARGIDIDDLPHVVNYEIPNVCEDYVHRIGRTGRAGAQGEAVSLVSLDEEGFMMAIEKFTKQQIPVEIFPEFMPEPGEKAEPIAMGRQTIWGGAGKPPSREVMAAAAKAARSEMMERIRDKKAHDKGGQKPARGAAPRAQAPRDEDDDSQPPRHDGQRRHHNGPRPGAGANGPRGNGNNRPRPAGQGARGDGRGRPAGQGQGAGNAGAGGQGGAQRQPDPLRTGIDALGERGRNNRGRGGRPGGGGQGRSGGGGGGGIDPLRTSYGRIK